jgi:hypothetical protein
MDQTTPWLLEDGQTAKAWLEEPRPAPPEPCEPTVEPQPASLEAHASGGAAQASDGAEHGKPPPPKLPGFPNHLPPIVPGTVALGPNTTGQWIFQRSTQQFLLVVTPDQDGLMAANPGFAAGRASGGSHPTSKAMPMAGPMHGVPPGLPPPSESPRSAVSDPPSAGTSAAYSFPSSVWDEVPDVTGPPPSRPCPKTPSVKEPPPVLAPRTAVDGTGPVCSSSADDGTTTETTTWPNPRAVTAAAAAAPETVGKKAPGVLRQAALPKQVTMPNPQAPDTKKAPPKPPPQQPFKAMSMAGPQAESTADQGHVNGGPSWRPTVFTDNLVLFDMAPCPRAAPCEVPRMSHDPHWKIKMRKYLLGKHNDM